MSDSKKAVLIILDGFGIGPDSPFNAIKNADMPFYKKLWQDYPHSQLLTHGPAVGLPESVMGNSEVGHTTMGAGRILYQDLVKISRAISDKSFYKNPVLLDTIKKSKGRVHLLGLLSDGGVHSHQNHLHALIEMVVSLGAEALVHIFMDGRDTPPQSGQNYLQLLLKEPAFAAGKAHLASMGGRFFAMDRDQRWERTDKGLAVILGKSPVTALPPLDYLRQQYRHQPKGDEFVEPACFSAEHCMRQGDSAIIFNYRADRVRQPVTRLHPARNANAQLSQLTCMTEYDPQFALPVAFENPDLKNLFGEMLAEQKLRQFRIAETEKYAHVTFFFNGGREKPYSNEDRLLIPSAKEVETYDQKPEMSAPQIAEEASKRIQLGTYHFVLMNFANADMVGHTGNYAAARKAMECLDRCLAQVIGAAQKHQYHVLLTADHGNAEEMQDGHGHVHTQHTLNPVPAIWVAPQTAIAPKSHRQALENGSLADIYPSLCQMMNLPIPTEVTGKSLLPC